MYSCVSMCILLFILYVMTWNLLLNNPQFYGLHNTNIRTVERLRKQLIGQTSDLLIALLFDIALDLMTAD